MNEGEDRDSDVRSLNDDFDFDDGTVNDFAVEEEDTLVEDEPVRVVLVVLV